MKQIWVGGGPRAASASQEQEQSKAAKCSNQSWSWRWNLLRKVVHNGGDSFGWLLIQEWILVLQSFRESSFSGKPASFVTKVAVFYWQACKVSGGGNSATELKLNVKKWKVSYCRIARFLEGNSAKECWWWLNVKSESVFICRTSGFLPQITGSGDWN